MNWREASERLLQLMARPVRRGSRQLALETWPGILGPRGVFAVGRLTLRKKSDTNRTQSDNNFATLMRLFRRGVAGVELKAHIHGHTQTLQTDENGYFTVHIDAEMPVREEEFIRLEGPGIDERLKVFGWPEVDRLVLSDIDDTVVATGAANKWWMFVNLLIQGAEQRTTYAQTADFFQGLCANAGLILVSRSPWAIHRSLNLFFDMHKFPSPRVLVLRDWGLHWRPPFFKRAIEHKREVLRAIMRITGDVPCILIGDSGQSDPAIYLDLTDGNAERIEAVFIRDVTSQSGDADVLKLGWKLKSLSKPFCFAAGSDEFIAFSKQHTLIED